MQAHACSPVYTYPCYKGLQAVGMSEHMHVHTWTRAQALAFANIHSQLSKHWHVHTLIFAA